MSYDFDVFLGRTPNFDELADAVTSVPGLAIVDRTRSSWQVVRGSAAKYSFTLEPTVRIDGEDLPNEVAELMFTPHGYIEIIIEGSDAKEISFAWRVARTLADRFDGVALDKQTDELWPRRSRRSSSKPRRSEIVSLVEFHWFVPPEMVTSALIEDWLALCHRYVPEALPRRYGGVEPLQGKLAEGGEQQLLSEWDVADDTMYFVGTSPVTDGSLPVIHVHQWDRERLTKSVKVSVLASALEDDRWTVGFRALFTEFARRSSSAYSYGEVVRGYEWSGRKVWFSLEYTERTLFPGRGGGWLGLLPYPVFWAWYGHPYASLLGNRLAGGTQESHDGAIFHQLADGPLDRDALRTLLKPRRLSRPVEWVPHELRATELPNPEKMYPTPSNQAAVVPDSLRR